LSNFNDAPFNQDKLPPSGQLSLFNFEE